MWYMVPWNAANKLCNVICTNYGLIIYSKPHVTRIDYSRRRLQLEIVNQCTPELSQLTHVIKYYRNWIKKPTLAVLNTQPLALIIYTHLPKSSQHTACVLRHNRGIQESKENYAHVVHGPMERSQQVV